MQKRSPSLAEKPWYQKNMAIESEGRMESRPASPGKQHNKYCTPRDDDDDENDLIFNQNGDEEEIDEDVYEEDFEEDDNDAQKRLNFQDKSPRQLDTDPEAAIYSDSDFEEELEEDAGIADTTLDISIDDALQPTVDTHGGSESDDGNHLCKTLINDKHEFEESNGEEGGWTQISFDDIELGDQIGG